MEYDPPIETRTTEQLIEIVETRQKWQPDVVDLAKAELIRRGISLKIPGHRRRIKLTYERKIDAIKSGAEYTDMQKVLIALLGPFLFIVSLDPFIFRAGQGFKKKNRQGILYLLLGLVFWGLIIYVYFQFIA